MRVNVGGWIRWDGHDFRVSVIEGDLVRLIDEDGRSLDVARDDLILSAERTTARTSELAELTKLDLPGEKPDDPWIQAIRRVQECSPGKRGFTLQREAAHLSAMLGRSVSARTLTRRVSEFEERGRLALQSERSASQRRRGRHSVDPRVLEIVEEVLAQRAGASTTSRTVAIYQVETRVARAYGSDVSLPSRATMHRLMKEEERGRFSFGSAKTRHSLALSPDREFGSASPTRPGELVEMDSTVLDVAVRIDEKTIGRPELTTLVDVATRSVLAATLRPEGTKSIDLIVTLARALVPYSRRLEGVRETRRLISTAWAEDVLVEQERYERMRLAQPFIFPETITTDRGKVFLSQHFQHACETLHISLITAASYTPTNKPHVERGFGSVDSLFLQYFKDYVGRSAEHRGKKVALKSENLFTIEQMQELLEDWVAVTWQNRSHSGLRDPLYPRIALSPNEMCQAFRRVAPEVHVPLTREDYIALLPVDYRAINRYGVNFKRRVYDSRRLNDIRRRMSPLKLKKGKWPIRYDPYNFQVVWLEAEGEFIPLRWANNVHTMPRAGEVWREARAAHRTRDAGLDAERDELTRVMREVASKGNPTRPARATARMRAVANDPMNMTSAHSSVDALDAESEASAALANADTSADSDEAWPHSGGFSYTDELLNETKGRVES